MEARLLSKAKNELNPQQIKDFIIGCTQGLIELKIHFTGFYYEPEVGIYLVGPREELEKVENKNGVEDFDFVTYIYENPSKTIWIMDWSDEDDPKLLVCKK